MTTFLTDDEPNTNPFFMYDAIEYPKHMRNSDQRIAFYVKAVEVFDTVETMEELKDFEEEHMEDMRYMGHWKHSSFEKMIISKKLYILERG